MQSFTAAFSSIDAPRVDRTKKHKFIDILFIPMAAVLCGCDEWEEIEMEAEKKEAGLRKHLERPRGLPSHDPITRVISAPDPAALQQCFGERVSGIATLSKGEAVSVDGKRLCGSGQRGHRARGERLERCQRDGAGHWQGGGQKQRANGYSQTAGDAGSYRLRRDH